MEFKRLNNMTGSDPVLNKRIISIFSNELGSLRKLTENFTQESFSELEFAVYKIKPSLLIFELDNLVKEYESLFALLKNDEKDETIGSKSKLIITLLDEYIGKIKQALIELN